MEKLSEKNARILAREIFLNSEDLENQFHYIHTKNVVNIIGFISKKFKLNIDKMQAIAWVHDIGYSLNNELDHCENSLKILKDKDIFLDKIEEDCIKNHSSSKKPMTLEAKLFKIADKLSVFDSDFIEILLKQDNITLEDIKDLELMSTKGIDQIKELKQLLETLN